MKGIILGSSSKTGKLLNNIAQDHKIVEKKAGSDPPVPLAIIIKPSCNINYWHKIVINHFQYRKEQSITDCEVELHKLENKYKYASFSEKKALNTQIEILKKNLEKIKDNYSEDDYQILAEDILTRFNDLGVFKEIVSFDSENEIEDHSVRLGIISEYTDLVKKFFKDVNINYQDNKKIFLCKSCGLNITNLVGSHFIVKCPICTVDNEIIIATSKAVHNDNDNEDNFVKAMDEFEGTENFKLPANLFDELDTYFTSKGMMIGIEVKKQSLDEKGRRGKIRLDVLYAALKGIGKSSLYEHARLISHEYWGWRCPDITHLRSKILEHYRITQAIYKIIPKYKKSSLPRPFRLFKHLQLVGYKCNFEDFKMPSMIESLELCETLWKSVCENCDNEEIYFIPTI